MIVLGGPLFSSEKVLSDHSADLGSQFLFSRAFGFGEMAHGHLPLWNPYIYGGVPFLGDFQSALLYPLNLIFLILPLATAINWSFALHVFLLGAAMYFWGVSRALLRPAAFVAGVAAMFSGSFFLHIYAGHLSNVCAMAWVPVIFLGIDGWLNRRNLAWVFLASAGAALQIYAGHPQYVYYTALVAGIYSLAHLPGASRPWMAVIGLVAIYPLAALLAAAQLLPGLAAASESVRSGGVNYEFASMFSLPPENLLTLVTPWFYGDMQTVPYWGRCYLWEMNIFAGAGMILLACHGALRPGRYPFRLLAVLLAVLLLALGAHTPVHRILYEILPGFSSFRGASKFIFFGSLVVALLAGMGLDRLLRRDQPISRKFCYPILGLGAIALGMGAFLQLPSSVTMIRGWMEFVVATRESYLNPAYYRADAAAHTAQMLTSHSLLISGALLLLFAGLLLCANRWPKAIWAFAVCAALELTIFARGTVTSFPLRDFSYEPIADFLKKTPGDYRTLNLFNPDASMMLRSENIWGYDPTVLKRYAQLLSVSQGADPATASQYLQFSKPHPILNLLRCRFAFVPKADGQIDVVPMGDPLPHFYLVSKYEAYPSSAAALHALQLSSYGLREKVLLETEPNPKPGAEMEKQEIKVLDSSTDYWRLEVMTDQPAILVMTDAYSKDWRATSLPGSTQSAYELLPANVAIRAIPLAAGHHLLKISYSPRGLYPGIFLTLATLAALLGSLSIGQIRRRLALAD